MRSRNAPAFGSDAVGRLMRWSFIAVLAGALGLYVVQTLHWPMLVDSPVMHYVVFLTKHGFRPYRDITDNNMPGAYLVERTAMAIFGGGDLGWRFYDFFLLASMMGAMVVIAWPYDRLAGVFAAGLFAMRHGAEGPWFAGEREQAIAAMIAGACACLFVSVRRNRPWLVAGFGLLVGVASSIKPTMLPIGLGCLIFLGVELRKHGRPWHASVAWGVAGAAAAFATDIGFLWHYHAFGSFLYVVRKVTPVYVGLNHPGLHYMLVHLAPFALVPLLLGMLLLFREQELGWERWVLLFVVICGLASYFAQQKGFNHHRYLFLAFALLVSAIELLPLLEGPPVLRWVGFAGVLYATVYVLPHDARVLQTLPTTSPMTSSMETDLEQLGGKDRLQGQVQCFDLILGCLNSLYHLKLVENTGFTGDLLLFPTRPNSASNYYQNWFWRAQALHPASVLVMTNEDFGEPNSFNRLQRWPEFDRYLNQRYQLAVTRTFPREGKKTTEADEPEQTALRYRIYLLRGSSFPSLSSKGVSK